MPTKETYSLRNKYIPYNQALVIGGQGKNRRAGRKNLKKSGSPR